MARKATNTENTEVEVTETEEVEVPAIEVEAEEWVTEAMTPYRLAEHVSTVLSERLEADIEIKPQQIYGAVRSGSLEVGTFDSGHKKVTPEKANEYIATKLGRALTRQAKAASKA